MFAKLLRGAEKKRAEERLGDVSRMSLDTVATSEVVEEIDGDAEEALTESSVACPGCGVGISEIYECQTMHCKF